MHKLIETLIRKGLRMEEIGWLRVKKKADKIGYCCFTPEDQNAEIEV